MGMLSSAHNSGVQPCATNNKATPNITWQVYSGDAKVWIHGDDVEAGQDKPRWAEKPPVGYVQQIIMKAAVHPYNDQVLANQNTQL